jgi:hypothetical protein
MNTKERAQNTSQNSNPILDLKKAFAARNSFYTNRSSSVFPIYFKNSTNDLHIVFLNYWTLKNNIPKEKLAINFRIYNNDGNLIKRHTELNFNYHNQFSIRNMLSDTSQDYFEGMIEVEIISSENLRFTFPGITAIYQTGDIFSAVHAAGRVKGPDELQTITNTQETNWTCKFSQDITPFFHFFIGNKKPTNPSLKAFLRSNTGNIIEEKIIDISNMNPFASKLFFADELFDKKNQTTGNFISVLVEHGSIFPRLVVGNYFKEIQHIEATHSFPLIEKSDYCLSDDKNQIPSILNCYTDKNLSLTLNVFPTNCVGNFKGVLFKQEFNQNSLTSKNITKEYSTSILSNAIKEKLEDNEKFLTIQLHGNEVPSRFNASYIYKVRGSNSSFSTDIASGAKSCAYPPKHRHWGQAYVENGFDTSILIRNNFHKPSETKSGNGMLTVYSNSEKFELKFKIAAESAISISLHESFEFIKKTSTNNPGFLSWLIEMDIPTCESFWISYRMSDGAIFGEHGF